MDTNYTERLRNAARAIYGNDTETTATFTPPTRSHGKGNNVKTYNLDTVQLPVPANVAAYYAARDGLRDAMEGQHQAARAYVMPDMYTAIDEIVDGYIRIENAALQVEMWASSAKRRACELAAIAADGQTMRDVFDYETARTNRYLAAIKRGN